MRSRAHLAKYRYMTLLKYKCVHRSYYLLKATCNQINYENNLIANTCQLLAKGTTPLEISYACPEINGNHDRNHWKSGNQASRQKSQLSRISI